ncbi:phosphate acetyltransferase [Microlunatus parietis]|uniref:Phosphate acetyltransferase n=1 Tax=Microlunatus parietis TaxID=682979 RepID=A0A7Y9LBR8_9ACTN|nr:phosphate acetyltransferase [Microlunatus parietis]NYE72032.1 phosphate acetyltransferase [Microlunatus parietis]
MNRTVYVASVEGQTGKSAVALGLLDALIREVGSVGVFRPLISAAGEQGRDVILDLLVSRPGIEQTYEEAVGVGYEAARADPDEALHQIVQRCATLRERFEVVLVLGSDYTDITTATELSFNAKIAANLGAPVVLVVHGRNRTPEQIRAAADGALAEFRAQHAQSVAVIANRVDPGALTEVVAALTGHPEAPMVAALPESPMLSAPTVRMLGRAVGGSLVQGVDAWQDRESQGIIVAAMTLPNVLDRLTPDATVITASDRADLIPGLVLAHQSGTFPALAAIVLTGGYPLPDSIRRLARGIEQDLPVLLTELGTFDTAERLSRVRGPMTKDSTTKIETARRLFAENVDQASLLRAIEVSASPVRTPIMFEHQVMERARAQRMHIVLPESTDDRILEAAAIILRRGVAELTLLGDATKIGSRASSLGLQLDQAKIISPNDPELVERFAAAYAEARAHKGVTPEKAREVITDGAYFGTMMVHLGLADGMVSGAINTTAHTIRPALEFIKTRPGVDVVSSVFLMCLADRVLVYGDCAVIPEPTVDQLADIAIASAETARQFDVEPRVAMLSYSTGSSGTGSEVDRVRAATELVAQREPDLPLEGPIQYDAAIDPGVAATKLPDSDVAGKATVFIFPDLNTGNNTYKAVQRSAGAVAVGPVLQGLKKPVNDLSRGATVDDIVNTVAITAIQAQAVAR